MASLRLKNSVVVALFVGCCGWSGQVLFPPGSDGSWLRYSSDGWEYGEFLDHPSDSLPGRALTLMGLDPASLTWFHPNHPGYQASAWLVHRALRPWDVKDPGHVAVRVVASLGAALTLLLLASFVGPISQIHPGWLLTLAMVALRGYWFEACTGESLLPSVATILWCLRMATRGAGAHALGLGLSLMLLMRQDAILVLPGILLLAARHHPALVLLRVMGVVTLVLTAVYSAAWAAYGFQHLRTVVLGVAQSDWSAASVRPIMDHLAAASGAITGRLSERPLTNLTIGVSWLLGAGVATWLLAPGSWQSLGGRDHHYRHPCRVLRLV